MGILDGMPVDSTASENLLSRRSAQEIRSPMITINRRTLLTALAAAGLYSGRAFAQAFDNERHAMAREAAADAGRSPLCRGPSDERDNRRHSAG